MQRILVLACALILALPLSAPIPVRAAGFTVNSPIDAPDANPGDGICATAAGLCSLRAAIQEANATPTADIVTVPPGTYVLSLAGRGEDLAATGDLDINDASNGKLTIVGTGTAVVDQLGQLAEAGVQRVMLQWLNLDDLDGLAALAQSVLAQL